MSQAPAYCAAEYFVEALKKSVIFNINYKDINLLLQHASPDINSYFQKEGKDDVFFVFKQFPDVFVLNGFNITLTDAFLALFAFPESTEFRPTYKCQTVFETSVIEYFKLILARCVMCNYLTLFNVLLTQNKLLASYFSRYTEADMYAFLQKYTGTFTLILNNVYLNRAAPINFKTFDDLFCEKSLKKLAKTASFLLTSFTSLHYIELRQVISFVISNVMEYLNMFSLIKQREIFENLPDTVMNKMGYLSLKNFESPLPKSKKLRLVLLIVCIIAFEREIHFLKIGEIIQKRVSSDVSSILCNLSISDQFKYFRELPEYFLIYDDGYVTLLPTFVFPFCSFDSSLSNPENNFLRLQPSTFVVQTNVVNIIEGVKNLSIAPNNNSNLENIIIADNLPKDLASEDSSNNPSPSTGLQNYDLTDSKGSLGLIDVRLKLSVIFLIRSFPTPVCKNVLKTCLFVLNDIQVSFIRLPLVQQINYVKEFDAFFESILKEGLLSGMPSMPCINGRERVLLFIVYVLINEKVMLFEKLSWWLDFGKIDSAFSKFSVFGKLVYFKEMSDYLTVSVNGNVSLNKSFDYVNDLVDSYCDIFCKLSFESENSTLTSNECTLLADEKSSNKSLKQNFVRDILPSASEGAVNELNMPFNLYKKLLSSIVCLEKWFSIFCMEDILQTCLYAVNDIKAYFLELSSTEQQWFILNYFQYTYSKSFSMSLKDSSLTEDEKAILVTTYLLIQNKTMHYEKIVNALKAFKISSAVYGVNAKQQFKFFKTLNDYFGIHGNGQVHFSSAYSVLRSIINPIFFNHQSSENSTQKDLNNTSSYRTEIKLNDQEIKNIPVSLDDKSSGSSGVNMIIDLCVSLLSVREKMKVEKLCSYLGSSRVKNITNYFSFHTVTEKTKFFSSLPKYFEVSSDDFVSLKKDVVSSYVPKTSLILQDSKGRFVCNNEVIADCTDSSESVTSGFLSYASKKLSVASNSSADDCCPQKKNNLTDISLKSIKENVEKGNDSADAFSEVATIETCNQSIPASQNYLQQNLISNEILDSATQDIITDFSVSILSVEEKMTAKSLCRKIRNLYEISFGFKNLPQHATFGTRRDKFVFFLNNPKYFEISQGNFVSLKKNVLSSYVPKTSLIVQDSKGHFVCKNVKCLSCSKSRRVKNKRSSYASSNNFSTVATIKANTGNIPVSQNNEITTFSATDVTNIILDISISILSDDKKIAVKTLCKKIKKLCKTSFSRKKNIKNMFQCISFQTRFEKLNFFLNYPKLFEINQNDFVSLKRNVISSYVPKTNLIYRNSKGNFVCKDVECSSSSESEASKKNTPADDNSKNSRFDRRPTINSKYLKGLKDLLTSIENTNTIAYQNSALKMKPDISQTTEHTFLNFSSNVSENTVSQNFVFDTSQAINNKHQTYFEDSSVSGADLQFNYQRSDAYSKPTVSYETKNISEEIKPDPTLNCFNSVIESKNDISSVAGYCDKSHYSKLKQNLNTSSVQKNAFHQSSFKDTDVVSSDEDLEPYTLYGLELLDSFYGEYVSRASACTKNNLKSQNCPTAGNYDYPIINDQKVPIASNNHIYGALQDDIKTNDQFLCKSMPSKSNVPLKQIPSFDDVEIQAVNFFSVILGNYETGVSADFLMKHLNIASEKVQNFMLSSFQSDAVSFFMKHEAAFYVSPITKNIYLVKNS